MKKTGSQVFKPANLILAPELLRVQGLMPISGGDRKRLKADIEKNGVRDPLKVYMGEDGKYYVLAGATRLAIAQELGLSSVPIEIYDAPESERETFAIEENLARRHLTSAQKVKLARHLVRIYRELSDRAIAAMAGTSPTTVGKVRAEEEENSGVQNGHPAQAKRTGKDGRKQAARKATANQKKWAELERKRKAEAAKRPVNLSAEYLRTQQYLLTLMDLAVRLPKEPPKHWKESQVTEALRHRKTILKKLAPLDDLDH